MKRKISTYLPSIFLLLLCLAGTACTEDVVRKEVSVGINMSGGDGFGAVEWGAESEDQLHSLRVIVSEFPSQKIVYNYCPPYGTPSIGFELPAGLYDFYFIGNEEGLYTPGGISPGDLEGFEVDLNTLKELWLDRLNADDYISNGGIPFSNFTRWEVSEEQNRPSIRLNRALSRVCLSFVNKTGKRQTLKDVRIAGIKSDKGKLFEPEPEGNMLEYSDLLFHDVEVEADEGNAGRKKVRTHYIYPGENKELEQYVLTATWNGNSQQLPLNNIQDGKLSTFIPRNTQLNIVITLKPGDKIDLDCTVLPWGDGGSSEIEYDEAFSAKLENISGNKVVGEPDNEAYAVVYGYPDKELTFRLTVSNPKGATWTANVTNGLDFEVKKTDGSWASGGIDGEPVMLTVRPRRAFEVGQTRETELYITLTQNMVNKGEQVINSSENGAGLHPGTTTRIRIRQVSINDFNQLNSLK